MSESRAKSQPSSTAVAPSRSACRSPRPRRRRRPGWPRLSAFLLLAALAAAPAVAQTAAAPVVNRLDVALWPEYDRPQMLVMLRGELAPGTPLPASLTLPLPAEVGSPHAVAWGEPGGGLKVAQHTVEAGVDGNLVTATLFGRAFRVEYYAAIEKQSGDPLRLFTFAWPGGPVVQRFTYEVQVPPDAYDAVVSPSPAASSTGPDGLTYLAGELGTFTPGDSARIQVAYRRDSDALTATPAATAPPTAAGGAPAAPAAGSAAAQPPAPAGGTPRWPVYVAAALLAGILIGIAIERTRR